MKILIVDDERVARNELKYQLKQIDPDCTCIEADSYESALTLLESMSFDGAFFDIELPDQSGLELAKVVSETYTNLPFVFSTAYDSYALPAFSVKAVDYILKPFKEAEVNRAYSRFLQSSKPTESCDPCTDKLTVWLKDKAIIIQFTDILYITTSNKETVLTTKNNEYIIKHTLNYLEEKLPSNLFMRVQRGFIVNMNIISGIIPWFNNEYALKLHHSKTVIPVSRNKIHDLKVYFDF